MSIDLGGGFVAHELHEWGGTSAGRPLVGRVAQEWLHHSVTIATANAFGDFRTLDGIGRSRGHRGVSYSELIHPDGTVGIGQGDRVGAHTGGHNSTSRGVVIICNCDQQIPTDRSIEAYRRLREWKIRTGRLAPGTFPTGGHRDTGFSTACPGQHNQSRIPLFRAGSGPTPAPAPAPPPVIESGDPAMDGLWLSDTFHWFYVDGETGEAVVAYRTPDGGGGIDKPFPPGWPCARGARARVRVIHHGLRVAVGFLREDEKHVNFIVRDGNRWRVRGAPG